jgi:predicted AAA+ superfamily ATPase
MAKPGTAPSSRVHSVWATPPFAAISIIMVRVLPPWHENLGKRQVKADECYFWGTHGGAELDLLVVRGKQRLGFEIKRTDTPVLTPSMRHALHDLKLDRLWVVHAGRDEFPLHERTTAIGLDNLVARKSLG